MPKVLTIIGLTVSALIVAVFALDHVVKFPFKGANRSMDLAFVVCGVVLAYLSWSTMREQS